MDQATPGEDVGLLAEKLRLLFARSINPATGKPYTTKEAADEIARRADALPEDRRAGMKISATYVWQLVNGKRRNPTIRHVESLADLFGVPLTYLIDSSSWRDREEEIGLAMALGDEQVRNLAFRARGLSPNAISALEVMIAYTRQREGLDPAPTDGP